MLVTQTCGLVPAESRVSKISVFFLTQKKSILEESVEESRAELLALRTNHADAVGCLEAQVEHSFLSSLAAYCCRVTSLLFHLRCPD